MPARRASRIARTEIERTVQPSLLDRLTDLDPDSSYDPAVSRAESARSFRASVQRDVEGLLNTRRTIVAVPDNCPEVRASVHEFGLTDITGVAVNTSTGRDDILSAMSDAIERFEPRMSHARISLVEGDTRSMPTLHFVLEATLRMDPNPERVVFDTMLEIANSEYAVGGDPEPAAGG
jgi:type VI secretion system protein ImpF